MALLVEETARVRVCSQASGAQAIRRLSESMASIGRLILTAWENLKSQAWTAVLRNTSSREPEASPSPAIIAAALLLAIGRVLNGVLRPPTAVSQPARPSLAPWLFVRPSGAFIRLPP